MRIYFILFIYFLLSFNSVIGQSANNCGVIASMNPAGDSIYNNYSFLSFTNTSVNATNYEFYIDGVLMSVNNPLATNIPVGLSEIMLVASNGNCFDTIRTYHFFSGTPPTNNFQTKVHFGIPFMRHKVKDFIKSGGSGFLITSERDNPSFISNAPGRGIISKINNENCVKWTRRLETNELFGTNGIQRLGEDNVGNIYACAVTDFQKSSVIFKLDSLGTLIWSKQITSSNGKQFEIFNFKLLHDGGIVLIGKTLDNANIFGVIRLSNAGNILWQKNYQKNILVSDGLKNITEYNNALYLGGTATFVEPNGTVSRSIFMKIGLSSGNTIWTKAYNNVSGLAIFNNIHLGNNEFLCDTYISQSNISTTNPQNIASIIKLDTNGIFVNGKLLVQSVGGNLPNTTSMNSKIVSLSNKQIYIVTLGSLNLPVQPTNSSMSSVPIVVNSVPFSWDSDVFIANSTIQNYTINLVSDFSTLRYVCPNDYIDSCNFFKLTGPSRICNLTNIYSYKIHKNKSCNLTSSWVIPAGVIVISQTDTLLKVRFLTYGSYLIKSNRTSGCSEMTDSMFVSVNSPSAPVLNLGNDFSLCTANTAVLHAGPSFLSYEWQNGSTDSIFLINSAGQYHVKVTDSCANILRDTINVSITSTFPMNAGPDRMKCNNDTIHLSAPVGYSNYQWSPAYNLNTTTTQNVIASPIVDTIYFIQAEITPGCYAFDSIKVTVKNSPSINLGNDRDVCFGDSILLNAGSGFVQYLWNNGSDQPQIWINSIGNYSVKAVYSNGCISTDSLNILNIKSPITVNLDKNSTLCLGETRLLDAGSGFVNYLWNNNLNTQKINITSLGFYKVIVIDINGCKSSDSIQISAFVSPPANFLLDSVYLCDYEIKKINSIYEYKNYLWNTGDITKEVLVNSFGNYFLTVTDLNGCKGKDSIAVKKKKCPNVFFIPNAFSPDNNGKNDFFKPTIKGNILNYNFKVYNRYGNIIFTTNNSNLGWNGNINGVKQNMGVFTWICSYQFEDSLQKIEKGTVLLLR